MEYRAAVAQVAAEASVAAERSKKARSSGGSRRCSNCGETGYNVRSCTKALDESLESEASTQFIMSDPTEE